LTGPELIVHCDWSKNQNRRWMAEARLVDGKYLASAPELVGNLNDPFEAENPFLTRIQRKRRQGTALIGFDFPIGLPKTYAGRIGARQFPAFLRSLEAESQFFAVCSLENQISLVRPFYPHAPGGKRQEQLTNALGIEFQQLLRTCDQATHNRPEASALFWTLGAKQVGKAAIVGWRDVLAPALRAEEIKLWPFDGPLDSLLKTNQLIAAETYPAQYYASIFGQLKGSKTNQIVRAESAPAIFAWAANRSDRLQLDSSLRSEIQSGFHHGDDAFDATIGLFGMIDAIQNYSPALEPKDTAVQRIEGWIFGQPAN
jgi:hypothetical protein